jgi:hypothetical protein
MKLTCFNKHEFDVRGAFYWRYPIATGKCPECGLHGFPDKKGANELASRDATVREVMKDKRRLD